ncbi:MAG: DUF3787 domain-containing protein [Eubacteriales bacterium]|nr:DUF3787 domain-containing protein [Eubacteriales bacterium]MDD4566253.1 DUF3787 domain-containing protein [Eubacteriales bacterium]
MKDDIKDVFGKSFKTFPLADIKDVQKSDNVTIPTEGGVKATKDWVDYNEK